jgi:hypothetical protein
MKLRLLPITPLTRECNPSAMLRRKVISTWEKMSAAQLFGSGNQLLGFRKPSGPPELLEPGGAGVLAGSGVTVTVGVEFGTG